MLVSDYILLQIIFYNLINMKNCVLAECMK